MDTPFDQDLHAMPRRLYSAPKPDSETSRKKRKGHQHASGDSRLIESSNSMHVHADAARRLATSASSNLPPTTVATTTTAANQGKLNRRSRTSRAPTPASQRHSSRSRSRLRRSISEATTMLGPGPICASNFSSRPTPFEDSLSACTWNAQGLFCQDFQKHCRKTNYCQKLCLEYVIVGIQEAHCGNNMHRNFDYLLSKDCRTWWSKCPGDRNLGGIGLILKHSFLRRFKTAEWNIYETCLAFQGRIAKLMLRGAEGSLDIYVVHLDHSSDPTCRLEQLRNLKNDFSCKVTVHTILIGDWNFDLEVTDRIDTTTGEHCGRVGSEAQLWSDQFKDFVEWYQGDFSRTGGSLSSRSRLDRIFSNMESSSYLELDWCASVLDPFRCEEVQGESAGRPSSRRCETVATRARPDISCAAPKLGGQTS